VVTELSRFVYQPETGFEDIGGNLLEADFGTTSSESALRRNFRLARQPEGIAATGTFGLATPKPTFQRKFSTV
jgi:hypothetical protein